jgi:DNA (cytosine-5)-methyltransferase 1
MTRKPCAIELFAGVGGMTLGFQQAGVRVVGAVELDEKHAETHRHNFPGVPCLTGDVAQLSARQIRQRLGHRGPIDIIFGGPPCQGFSIGGKMDPTDERNQLLLHFARLVAEFKPRFFVLENVKGLANERYEPLLKRFVRQVGKAGFVVAKPKVLNAADYGVPQRRQRLFMVGARGELNGFTYPDPTEEQPTVWDAISDLVEAFDTCVARGVDRFPRLIKGETPYQKELAALESGVTGFGSTEHSRATIGRFARVKPGDADPISRFIRLKKRGTSSTLRAGTGPERGSYMAPRPIHPTRARCICVREAARLQSFPDWFVFHEIKWHAFRQIGNSVPPKLARVVAEKVCLALRQG